MKTKIMCLTLMAIVALCMCAQSVSATPAISVEPSYLNVLQGDIFTVNITLDPAGVEVAITTCGSASGVARTRLIRRLRRRLWTLGYCEVGDDYLGRSPPGTARASPRRGLGRGVGTEAIIKWHEPLRNMMCGKEKSREAVVNEETGRER